MNNSSKNKLISLGCITALAALSLHAINKAVFAIATMHDRLNSGSGNYYKWRFGDIFYKKQGSGKPLLLIHDLNCTSSGYEWNRVVKQLSENHTVYTIDLIGCGRSEKPKFTYTNYLYVQLISDFIKHVIGHPADVAATGASGSFILMACNVSPELFDRIVIVNPADLSSLAQTPNKRCKTLKVLIETPIVGTLIYNMCTSRLKIKELFHKAYFSNKRKCSLKHVNAYYEAAHLGKANARYLFSSLKGRFVNINVTHALKQINNSITLLCGTDNPYGEEIMQEYADQNSSIERGIIPQTKHLPQLENPNAFLTQLRIYLP